LDIIASRILWNGFTRFLLFWTLVAGALFVLSHTVPYSGWVLVLEVLRESALGNIGRISNRTFAFALSSGIVQFAIALALAFFVMHVLLLRAAVFSAKRALGRGMEPQRFAAEFDAVSGRLAQNAVVRHAWGEFADTALREDDGIHNTDRPQTFINIGDARERLFGLKMMGAIPGYFVGLGLLLTFVGLVLALGNAAESAQAGSAENMTKSLNALLAAATFKFSTSIAGLGASLGLSLLFRVYQILIESSFDSFGRAVEDRMLFRPPQKVAAESRDILAAQRDELKGGRAADQAGRHAIQPAICGAGCR